MAKQSDIPMVSETSICNQAMTTLGASRMTALADRTKQAEWCYLNYPYIRDAVLQERMWTFASVRATSTTADRDAWGQMYAHAVPLNWLSVFKVYCPLQNNGTGYANQLAQPQDKSWRLEGEYVLSQYSTINLWGLIRITDTGRFSPMFVQALAARLAADACIALTQNRQLQADLWGLYNDKLGVAATRDGQQGENDVIQSNGLIAARYGGVPGAW